MGESGVRISNGSLDFIAGRLRPLGDRIIVKPLPVKASKILNAERKGSFRGVIIAVGPGEYPRKYNHDRSKSWRSERFQPTQVKPGDIVELGGGEHAQGYDFPSIMLNGEHVLIASEKDVCGIEA